MMNIASRVENEKRGAKFLNNVCDACVFFSLSTTIKNEAVYTPGGVCKKLINLVIIFEYLLLQHSLKFKNEE